MEIYVDHIEDLAIVECQGRIFRNDSALNLRDAVMSQADSTGIILDLSQVYTIDDGVLYMLVRLQRWAGQHNLELKLFNPTSFVRNSFEETGLSNEFKITENLEDLLSLIARTTHLHHSHAA
jgi:anti-anti-sigma factor